MGLKFLGLLFVVFSLFVLAGTTQAVGTYPALDPSMVLYLHMNNNATLGEHPGFLVDSSNTANATVFWGNGTSVNYSAGISELGDGAYTFDGSTGGINASNNSATKNYNFTQKNFTIAIWANTSQLVNTARLMSHLNGNNGFQLYQVSSNWKFSIGNGTNSYTLQSAIGSANVWNWLVGVYNGTDASLYVNGFIKASTGVTNFTNDPTTNLTIGSQGGGGYAWNGSIDEAIVWNRSLSPSEIATIYNNYNGCLSPVSSNEQIVGGYISLCNGVYQLNSSGNGYTFGGMQVSISNTTIYGNGSIINGNGTGAGFLAKNLNNVTIFNITFNNYSRTIYPQNGSYFNISNVTVTNSLGIGIYLVGITNSTINNNAIFNASGTGGFQLNGFFNGLNTSFNNITNNYLFNTTYGFYINNGSTFNNISQNTLVNCQSGVACLFADSTASNLAIQQNNFLNYTGIGLDINSTNDNISSNYINQTFAPYGAFERNAILLDWNSGNDTLYNNSIYDATHNGIEIFTLNNNVSFNTIGNARHNGIDLFYGYNNSRNFNWVSYNTIFNDPTQNPDYQMEYAVLLENGTGNNFTYNNITNVAYGLVADANTSQSYGNLFGNNVITNASVGIRSDSNNTWLNNSILDLSGYQTTSYNLQIYMPNSIADDNSFYNGTTNNQNNFSIELDNDDKQVNSAFIYIIGQSNTTLQTFSGSSSVLVSSLSNALISYSNGTTTTIPGLNQQANITLSPAETAFIYQNATLTTTIFNPANTTYLNQSINTTANYESSFAATANCTSYNNGVAFNWTTATNNTNYSIQYTPAFNTPDSYNISCTGLTPDGNPFTKSSVQYFTTNPTLNINIYTPANTTYLNQSLKTTYDFISSSALTANCTTLFNGAILNSIILANDTNTSDSLNPLVLNSENSYNVTCTNATLANTTTNYFVPVPTLVVSIFNPANTTYNTYPYLNATSIFNFISSSAPTATCNTYLDGTIVSSTTVTNNTNMSDNLDFIYVGQHNYTVTCTNATLANTTSQYFNIPPLVLPANINAFTAINVENLQGNATLTPFQVMLNVNSSNYSAFETANLSNVLVFNLTGSISPSWIESGDSNTSTSTVYWVLVNTTIPAYSNYTLFLGFANQSTNLFSSNTGLAPQLASSYGSDDSGASVFPILYQNFSGVTCPTGWTCNDQTINNGITQNTYNGVNRGRSVTTASLYGNNSAQTLDFYGNIPNPTSGGNSEAGYVVSTGCANGYTNCSTFDLNTNIVASPWIGLALGNGVSTMVANSTAMGGTHVFSIYSNTGAGNTNFTVDYTTSVDLGLVSNHSTAVGISNDGTLGQNIGPFNWFRIRTTPPNDVMPSLVAGSMQAITITSPTNSTYYGAVTIASNYTQTFIQPSFCLDYLNGVQLSNQSVVNGNYNGSTLTPAAGPNTYLVSCAQGGTFVNSSVSFYDFYGLNVTVSNAANGTILNGWNITASNTTFTNSNGTQNSSFLWNQNQLPLGADFLNVTAPNYAQSNYSQAVANNTFIQLNLGIWPLLGFNFASLMGGDPISAYTMTISQGASNVSCTTSSYECYVSLQNIPLGNDTVSIVANGYNSTIFANQAFTVNSSGNYSLYGISPAGLNVSTFDEVQGTPVNFNITITNGTSTVNWQNLTAFYNGSAFIPLGFDTITINGAAGGYQPRTYYVTTSNNTAAILYAYILAIANGQYVTFAILDSVGNGLPGATLTAFTDENGATVEVGESTSDQTGTGTFFLNPNTLYTTQVVLNGFNTKLFSIQPSTTAYRVYMTASNSSTNLPDSFDNVSFQFTPDGNYLNITQGVNMSFIVMDGDNELQSFSFGIYWNHTLVFNQTVIGSPAGGIITAPNVNTSLYSGAQLITVVGCFQKVNFPIYCLNQTYGIGNTNLISTSLQGALGLIASHSNFNIGPGIFIIGMLIAISVAAYIAGGGAAAAVVIVLFLAVMVYTDFLQAANGALPWMLLFVVAITGASLLYLRRGGGAA